MSDLIMKVKRNSAGAPDFSTAVEIEPKEYDPCGTCKHNGKSWHEEPCDGCCGNHSGYEPIGDLISRTDAIEALGEEPPVWYDGDDEIAERNQWRRDKAAIESLPSADRQTGEWIGEADGYADGEFVYDTWYCSICDFMMETDGDKPTWNFCPNCGARMLGEDGEV